jgi:hypothetical protein
VTRLAAAAVSVLAAAALAWAGIDLLARPAGGDAFTNAVVGRADVRQFDDAAALFGKAGGDRRRLDRAEAALAAQGGDARLRSRAQTLLGVLEVVDAEAHRRRASAASAAARAAFRRALALDPANDDAAADLELLYVRHGGKRRGQGQGQRSGRGSTQPAKPRGGQQRKGKGASSGPGGGY